MGVCSWFRVPTFPPSRTPTFPCSWHFRNPGTRERTFIQERGNAERKKIGMAISRSCEEMLIMFTQLQMANKDPNCLIHK